MCTHVYTLHRHYYSSLLSTHLPFSLAGWLILTHPVSYMKFELYFPLLHNKCHACICMTTLWLNYIPYPFCLPPSANRVTAWFPCPPPRAKQRYNELDAVTWSALGDRWRHKRWGTKNSIASVTCVTPMYVGWDIQIQTTVYLEAFI
jgi:hypothetical protein